MIRLLLVIQVPDPRDKRVVPHTLRPIDCLFLVGTGVKHAVRMIFNDIVGDRAAFLSPFGACLNVDVRHNFSP